MNKENMEINHLDQKMLKPFDDMLKCRVCSEFFNHCVMTACSHNFCSACLKKRLETESDCPTCYEDIQESELRSNRSMDKIVRIYKKLMKTSDASSSVPHLQTPINPQVPSSSVTQATSQTQNSLPIRISSSKTVPVQNSPLIHNIQPLSQSSTSFTISSPDTVPVQSISSTGTVTVPLIQTHPPTFPVKDEIMECDESEMQNLVLVSTSETANDSEDFYTKILRLLEENRQELEKIKQYIAQRDFETDTNTLETAELPCKSRQELIHFNSALREEEYFSRLYRSLRTIGGLNEGDVVRKCLCRIMKNSVALQYNWKGLRGEKVAFSKLENIVGLIFKTASYHSKTITRQTVNCYIKDWLMRAGDRDGGRRKREMKVSHKKNTDGTDMENCL